jgi:hypothetical protein
VGSPSFTWGTPDAGYHLGNWFVAGTNGRVSDARVEAVEPPRGDSTLACHVAGADFAEAVDLFAQLNHPFSEPVDLSSYAGLAFWVRLSPPNATLLVALNVGTRPLLSQSSLDGLFYQSFPATEGWERYELPFTDLERTTSVVNIDFVVLGGGDALDLWIDELSLLCRGPCP